MFVPSFLEVTISRSSGGYSGWVSLKDSHKKKVQKKVIKNIFSRCQCFGQLYRLVQNNSHGYLGDRSSD